MIVLFYHLVSRRTLPHVRPLYRYKTPRSFAADLRFLKSRFRVLAHDEAADLAAAGRPFPAGSALITIDDGFRECFSEIRPLLLRHRLPAVFFVSPGLIGNRRLAHRQAAALASSRLAALRGRSAAAALRRLEELLARPLEDRKTAFRVLRGIGPGDLPDRVCRLLGADPDEYLEKHRPYLEEDEVRRLAEDGFAIGGHGGDHTPLDGAGEEELERELAGSARAALELSGQTRAPFAFPFSGLAADPGILGRLLARHPFLSLVFGGPEVPGEPRIISRRLWADDPKGTRGGRTNLPRLLKEYAAEGRGQSPAAPGSGAVK